MNLPYQTASFLFTLAKSTDILYHKRMTPLMLSYTAARQNLSGAIRTCVDDSLPVIITSRGRKVVMIPYDEWESEQETQHILSNPIGITHVREGIAQIQRGETTPMTKDDILKLINNNEA
ncbi:MAG: type II toxin-antitoxin system prevent-host-death family antitoxin [Akkermansia sp.]